MKKITHSCLLALLFLSTGLMAADSNSAKSDTNNSVNYHNSKTCEAISKGVVVKDGKFDVDYKKFENPYKLRSMIDGVLIPGTIMPSFGIISGICSEFPNAEITLEVELASRGLNINSFDPSSDKLQQKLQNLGATQSWGVVFGFMYLKPELLGAFIDKVKEKRFGKNTIGIPSAKDILVDGTYKKELTDDEEKLVDEMVKKYLDALAGTSAAI